MIEAVVGVALRAVLASVVLGGLLALCVLAATRLLALTASTRHALWTTALIAIGVMPLAGIGVSLARPQAVHESAHASVPAAQALAVALPLLPAPAHEPAAGASTAPAPPATHRFESARDAVAGWSPRLSRTLALAALAAWAAGALIGVIGLAASVVRVRGLKRRSSPLDGALADELPWLTEVGPGREIYLRLSYETETPVAIGFRRPVILIPTELAAAGGLGAIESLILHEHAHLRRYDDWTNMAQRIIERVFWFNPIVWVIGRRIALEREIASDDAVVEKTGEAHEYATSLWKLAREMRMPEHAVVAPGALLTRKQISVRIERLLDKKRSRLHRSPAAAFAISLAALVAVGVVATSAPAVSLPAAPLQHVFYERVIVTDGTPPTAQMRSMPEPPARLPNATQRVVAFEHAAGTGVPFLGDGEMLAGTHLSPHLSLEVRRAIREAMAALPAHVAHAHGRFVHQHRRFDGMKVSREMVASCGGCSMRNADLHGVDLHGLRIEAGDFSGADMRNANLSGARVTGVSLAHADATGANLRGAHFAYVDLAGAQLDGADLGDARFDGCDLTGVSLRNAKTAGMRVSGSALDGG